MEFDTPLVWLIGLTLGGFVLICAELFLPGLIAGIAGALLLLAATILAFAAFGFNVGGLYTLGLMIFGTIGFALWMKYFDKTPIGKSVILAPAPENSQGFEVDPALVGKHGVALTVLRPSGTVEIDGQRYDALSEHTIIKARTAVQVIAVEGMKMTVRPLA